MESKIKIKMGQIEIEYEGSEAFLKEELTSLLTAVSDLYKESGAALEADLSGIEKEPPGTGGNGNVKGTTGSIAAKLGVKSGTELIMAAAGRMTFVLGKETFTRNELTKEMQSASAYYKKTYVNNLTKYINQLVKAQKLLETGANTYALNAPEKATMEQKLA